MSKISKKSYEKTYTSKHSWGFEKWIENIPEYCGKLLLINEGRFSSMHFHMDKKETMFLNRGDVTLKLIDPEDGTEYNVRLFTGDSILIPQGQPHQIIANEESELIEFSTTHFDSDSFRIYKGN
jgi:mannose-6-phosphate isomerase-like protein (cupin superfamily)